MKAIDEFHKDKFLDKPGLRIWLDEHQILFEGMIDKRWIEWADKCKKFADWYAIDPCMGYLLTKNDIKTDSEKQTEFLEWIINNSCILTMIGKRGGGKTAFCCWLAEMLKGKLNIVWHELMPNFNLPEWIKMVDNIEETPDESLIIINEAAVDYSSRSAMTKANKFLSSLLYLVRQRGLRMIFNTQISSGHDLKIHQNSDGFLIKPMQFIDTEDIEGQRTKTLFKYLNEMQPANCEETLFTNGNIFIRFSNPLPIWWSENISKGYRKLKPDELVPYVRKMLKQGINAKQISEKLKKMGHNLTEKDIKGF